MGSADVCVTGQLGSVRDAVLFRHMFFRMPQLRMILQLLKRWLRARAVPTSSEGSYPQVFWMRLAARTFQQLSESGEVPGGQRSATPTPVSAPSSAQAFDLLRDFCSRWSQARPAWGELLNLIGEEPCVPVKRLNTGVHGATALLCMFELRNLATLPCSDTVTPVPPHQHLCPAKAGFWAAFLVPTPGADNGVANGPQSELVVAWVSECIGPRENVRRCNCTACSKLRGQPVVSGSKLPPVHEYLSRRDADWVFLGHTLPEGHANGKGVPRHFALAPPHFVCLLDRDPAISKLVVPRLRMFLAEPQVAKSLPPAYPLNRYSRRVLLRFASKAVHPQKK